MFQGFSERAIMTIMLAQEEMRRLDQNPIGSESLFLGIMGEGGSAAVAIKSQGITLAAARNTVEKVIGRGSTPSPKGIPFTPRARLVLELALKLAAEDRFRVEPKHLLLAVIDQEPEGVAVRVMDLLGIDRPKLRKAVEAIPNK